MMNPKTTGAFISLLRKENHLTQKQLAEKLNVSDKAVSRWECGRGYPDVESLAALSDLFSVSINELLYGKRIETPQMAQTAEKDIADTYIQTNAQKKGMTRLAIASMLLLILLALLSTLTLGILYKKTVGSPNCVIANDYSYLTLFGERYVPLVLEDAECKVSEPLITEAQVEGTHWIAKLFFGDTVYSVKQCADNEIIYLQTDYDNVVSHYYCKEDKAEEYQKTASEMAYDRLSAELLTEDLNTYDLALNDSLSRMLAEADYTVSAEVKCDWSRGEGDESIVVYSYQTKGPFRQKEGELLRKRNEYYWFDYDDIPASQNNEDHSGISAYEIDDRYDEELDLLFSYMFK